MKKNRVKNNSPKQVEKIGGVKSFFKIFTYLKTYKVALIFAISCAFVGAILSLIGPKMIESFVNSIERNEGVSTLWKITAVLITLYLSSAILNYLQAFIMNGVAHRTAKNIRTDLSQKINKLPLKYLDSTPHGDIQSRFTNDVETIGHVLSNDFASVMSNITLVIGSVLMMFITNWILALVTIGVSLFGFLFLFIIAKNSQKFFVNQVKNLGRLNGHIEETYGGHEVIRVNNAEKLVCSKFSRMNKDLYNATWKSHFFSGLIIPLMNIVSNIAYLTVWIVGGVFVLNGSFGIGVILAFNIYVRLFMQPISGFGEVLACFQNAAAAFQRIYQFLNAEELIKEKKNDLVLDNIKGDICFENVCFGYEKNKKVIDNLNLEVFAGHNIAIVGPTGAGKTTIVNLLMRFYEIDSGKISIDGIDIRDMTREQVHSLFGMVLQDTWIFEGSVKENLRYNQKQITDEQIFDVCEKIGIAPFIDNLKDGYDTVLDDTVAISAGQKQLLTIARAMLLNKPMLILDEATSSVDTKMEKHIQRAMDELMKDRTSFVIAHRLSTIKNADLILVMKDGKIVEQGNHEELLKMNGVYAELCNS